MGTKSADAKDESQKHMFEVLGIPCVELALNGLNSTVSPLTEHKSICRCNNNSTGTMNVSDCVYEKCVHGA